MLLIGDKVVTDSPPAVEYPHQLDLGEAWHNLTGLPFVFATWMARADANLGDLPHVLDAQRLQNATALHAIADRYAAAHGWPLELARHYFAHHLRIAVGADELAAIEQFATFAHQLGLLPQLRPLHVAL